MKSIDILNKSMKTKSLEDCQLYSSIKKYKSILEDYNIYFKIKNDWDLLNAEILLKSLITKKLIDEQFRIFKHEDGEMYKYLNYIERKRLFNQEIHPLLKKCPSFEFNDSIIFLPFYNEEINYWYVNDYQMTLIKHNHELIEQQMIEMQSVYDLYGTKIYDTNFSSLIVVFENDNGIVYYFKQLEKLYFIKKDGFKLINFICLKDVRCQGQIKTSDIVNIVKLIMRKDDKKLINYMYKHHFILEKTYDKVMNRIE